MNVPSRQQTIGNQILINSQSGAVFDFFDLMTPPFRKAADKVAFIKSPDDGASWTKPQIIAGRETVCAVDPTTGQLYVVWQDSRFSGGLFDEIAPSASTDGGRTWSAPLRVNTPKGRPAFNPSVRVNSAATVAVTYDDFRDLAPGDTTTLPTNYRRTTSVDGAKSFGSELHLAGPFGMKTAPNAEGFFIGDYAGLDARGKALLPFFVPTNSGNTANRTDVFAAP